MSGNNESAFEATNNANQQSYQSNEIDKLLNSGKITNAVDFLHYFKNKHFPTPSQASTTAPHHQANVERPKRQKKSKSNLNDYVNIIQPSQQSSSGQQMKHNASFNNGVPNNNGKGARHKKTFSSNNISSLQATSTNNSIMKQTNSNMSLSSISIPDRQSPSPNSVQTTTTKAQFNKQRKSGISNSIPQAVTAPTQSIFNAYQINESSLIESQPNTNSGASTSSSSSGRPSSSNALELDSLNMPELQQSFKEQSPGNSSTTNTSPTPSSDPSGLVDFTPSPMSNSDVNNPQSISSQFLMNSAYYQKYRQQNQVHQHQQQPHQICHNNNNVQNYDQTDRKKEEAINRIIRNEKIKQIRTKMFEYELLKEYGALNPLPASIPSDLQLDKGTSDSNDQQTNYKPFIPSNSKAAKKLKKQQAKANNLFSSYNIDENIEDSDSDDKSSMSSQTNRSSYNNQRSLNNMAASRSSTTFENYKDDVFNMGRADEDDMSQRGDMFYEDHTTNEEEEDDFLFSDVSFTNRDDDNYESGIEEDSSFCKSMSMNASHGSKTVKGKKVKPGYERYDIGSVNCFGLSAFAQSTFHLKCSIINTEVKNIMNVLKQVF